VLPCAIAAAIVRLDREFGEGEEQKEQDEDILQTNAVTRPHTHQYVYSVTYSYTKSAQRYYCTWQDLKMGGRQNTCV
jgi:hypothetical protein